MKGFHPYLAEYLQDHASMVILLVDDDGVIIQSNQYARDLSGVDLQGKKLDAFFTDFQTGIDIHEIIRKQITKRMINVNTAKGIPETLYFSSFATDRGCLLIGEANHIEIQDLKMTMLTLNNELGNLARELQKKNVQLDQLNELKNKFLGMAAHDLRNPIASIMMFSDFILQDQESPVPEEFKHVVSIIKKSSGFMLNLLDELLDIVKIESGRLQLNYETMDTDAFLRNIFETNGIIAAQKQIRIDLEIPETLPDVECDPNKIEQVLNNLISNAIKYSYPQTGISVKAVASDDEMLISVTDQGQGIPEEELDSLFKPFSGLSSKGTAGEKSTGLGLSIAKSIIEGHKGRIWVESKPGEGSTFHFSLPLKRGSL